MGWRASGVVLVALAVAGCGSASQKATLNVDVSVEAPDTLQNITVDVSAPGKSGTRQFVPSSKVHWTVFFEDLKSNTVVTVSAKGFDTLTSGAVPVVSYSVRATLGPRETLSVPLKLSSSCTHGPTCQADENCEEGKCVKQPTIGIPGTGGVSGGTGGTGTVDAAIDQPATGGSGSGGAGDPGTGGTGGGATPGSGGAAGTGSGGTGPSGGAGVGGAQTGGVPGTGGGASGGRGGTGGTATGGSASGGRIGTGGMATGGASGGGGMGTGGMGTGGMGTGGANPCVTNNGGCSTNATCTQSASGRTCACKTGFTGDGVTCKKIDGQTCTAATECTSGQCVLSTCCSGANCPECQGDAGCTVAARPLCINNKCVACNSNAACKAKSAALPVCATAGANAGACVACNAHTDCTIPNKPICIANECRSCVDGTTFATGDGSCEIKLECRLKGAGAQECVMDPGHPAYGQCVPCWATESQQCGCSYNGTQPLCSNQQCVACSAPTILDPDRMCRIVRSPNATAYDYCERSTGLCRGGACNNDQDCIDLEGPPHCVDHHCTQ